jgi:hypothetical protein
VGSEHSAHLPDRWSTLYTTASEIVSVFHVAVEQSIVVFSPYDDFREALVDRKCAEFCARHRPFRAPKRPESAGTDPAWYAHALRGMAEAVSRYVEKLVADGWLGFVLYRSDTAAAYSYMLRRLTVRRDTLRSFSKRLPEDSSAPVGKRVTYQDWQRYEEDVTHVTEEHVHHLRNVSDVPFTTYRDAMMPRRVRELRERIPEWLRGHLRVMAGTIVQEEIYGRDERTERSERCELLREYKASPAVRLGNLVLVGWSSDDLKAEDPSRQGFWKKALLAAGVAGLALAVPAFGKFLARFFRP